MNQLKEYLKDPKIFNINRLESNSNHKFCSRGKELVRSLNGIWNFAYNGSASWGSIEVPGHTELQGYGNPQYVNTMYPWDGVEDLMPGDLPSDKINTFGEYRRQIDIPEEWKENKVYVSFQGVESAMAIYCNNEFVGYSEDTFTTSEFDLSPYLKEEDNEIRVVVYKWCSGSWLEDQDFWRLSGIFRDVFLYTIPEVHIRDISLTSNIDDNFKDAKLVNNIKLQYDKIKKIKVLMEVIDGEKIGEVSKVVDGEDEVRLELNLEDIRLWSAEKPNLYKVNTYILDGETDEVIETVPSKFGFRRFEMLTLENGNKVMTINGKRIVFKGVNRHEFNCYRGRSLTKEDMLWDIKFLKANNFNAVRSSHYPNDNYWYELCDEYGLYVIDEVNLETHGTWQFMGAVSGHKAIPDDKPEWLDNILDRAKTMYETHKNHTSIIIWSCGNESYGGENLYKMSEYLSSDTTRLVHYEGVFWDRRYNDTSHMESRMYAFAKDIEKYLNNDPQKPFINCEYTHAMGNSNGGLHKYTELEEKYEMYQGGFIWDYIDQGIMKKDLHGDEYLAYGGDFDDRPTDYNFCVNGLVYADRKPSPKMQEVKYLFTDYKISVEGESVTIRNTSLFTNINEYEMRWKLLKNGTIIESGKEIIDVEPLTTKKIDLNITKQSDQGEYIIEVSLHLSEDRKYAGYGHEVAFGQYIYEVTSSIEVKETETPTLVDGDCNIGVKGDNFHHIFSKAFGGMISMKYGKIEYLKDIVQPNFWRAPIDNDRGNRMPNRYSQWKIASMYPKASKVEAIEHDRGVDVIYLYTLPTIPATTCKVIYTVYIDGSIEVEMGYEGIEGLAEIPLFGMTFKLKKEYSNIKYYGMGPSENYIDRLHGARLGVHNTTTYDNLSEYVIPQECGNRTGNRWTEITDKAGVGIKVSKVSDAENKTFEFSALPHTAHELENAKHHYELPRPYCTVLNINLRQMGVGGDDSWGAKTHDEYLIPSNKDLNFKFKIERN